MIIRFLLLLVWLAVFTFDLNNIQKIFMYGGCIWTGLVTGLIFGDVQLGLKVGGTMQLMSMGLYAFGGASVPNYTAGTTIGTMLAIMSGRGLDYALVVGIPFALLGVQLDVLFRVSSVWFAQKAESCIDKGKYDAMERWVIAGILPAIIVQWIPACIAFFAADAIDSIIAVLPQWLMNGMNTAGSMLPAVGIGLLLHYMPTRKYWPYLLTGFVFSAYLGTPIFGVALIGLAVAAVSFMNGDKTKELVAVEGGTDDGDEL